MRLAYRLWLDAGGRAFGEGPAALLDLVRTEGSLSRAAAQMGMSYNKAWRTLHAAEARLGFALLERHIGGEHGGGSRLSPEGAELLRRYHALQADVGRELEKLYRKHFADWPPVAGDDAADG
jgi:molybdate transport system regulatory protein